MKEYLNQIGEQGSEIRLSVIASMNLGESEAAAKVLQKRARRKELMDMGHPFDIANVIVKAENGDCSC